MNVNAPFSALLTLFLGSLMPLWATAQQPALSINRPISCDFVVAVLNSAGDSFDSIVTPFIWGGWITLVNPDSHANCYLNNKMDSSGLPNGHSSEIQCAVASRDVVGSFAACKPSSWKVTSRRADYIELHNIRSDVRVNVVVKIITAYKNDDGSIPMEFTVSVLDKGSVLPKESAPTARDSDEIEHELRVRLANVSEKMETVTEWLPSIAIDGHNYYPATAARAEIERLRREAIASFHDAPALQGTIAEIVKTFPDLNTQTVYTARTIGNLALVGRAIKTVVSTESDVKAFIAPLLNLLHKLLAFDTMQPDVRCTSSPPAARIVVKVGENDGSERFTDTNLTMTKVWRGIYNGTASVLAGGFKDANVKLDIFNEVTAGIACTFELIGSKKRSVCVQTKGK